MVQSDQPTRLSPARLFSSPALHGTPPTDLRFSPDGRFVTFRAPAQDDRQRYDLYRIDLESGEQQVWLDARDITEVTSDVTELTAEERAQRERRRDFSHGITQYEWRPQHNDELLVPINGQAYLLDVSGSLSFRPLCPADTRQSDFKFSPDGRYLAYVRERDLYVLDIESSRETRLTQCRHESESYGLADFLAAEEMHRFEGLWWHEDSCGLFYTHVDESPVAVSHRLEVDAAGSRSVAQRYPFAGARNPAVALYYQTIELSDDGKASAAEETEAHLLWDSEGGGEEVYLARVIPLHKGVVILTQDRLQQRLRYLWQAGPSHFDAQAWQQLSEETASSWVNLNDDTMVCGDALVITDETTGPRRAMLLELDGSCRRLTGPTHINHLLGCNEDRIYATGWDETPIENHLYVLLPEQDSYRQLTQRPGWHEITLNQDGSGYIERYTDPEVMLEVNYVSLSTEQRTTLHREVLDAQHPYGPYLALHSRPVFGSIAAADGQDLYYRLTPPAEISDQHPVIVYVYGGPGAQKVRRDWGSALVQLFAQHGFGVLELDNRGSANRGRLFEAPLYRNLGGVEVADQVAGLAVLTQFEWADAARVGVFGHSYGGYMTCMCLTQAAAHFKAGVAVAPVCDWQLYDSHYTERYMGLPDDNQAGYLHGNVLTHLPALRAPLLLMHGMADDNVLFQNSTLIMNRLQELNKQFELMTYPGAKHSMQEPHVGTHRFELILEFFRTKL